MTTAYDRLCAAVFQSVSHTIENLVFMECEFIEPSAESTAASKSDSAIWFQVSIDEPFKGWVRLQGPQDLFQHFTHQLFAEHADALGEQGIIDAGGELANTVAGYLLGHLIPQQQSFSLGLPEHGRGNADDSVAENYIARVVTLIEGMTLAIDVAGAQLLDHAEYLPDLPLNQSANGVIVDAQDVPVGWGSAPQPDPETGRWPAGGTGSWGKA